MIMNKHSFYKLTLLFAILCLGSFATKAQETLTSPSGLKVTVPKGWKHQVGQDNDLSIYSADDLAHFVFIDIASSSLEAALNEAEKQIKKLVNDLKEGEPQTNQLNGLDAMFVDAKGKVDGQAMDLGILLVKNGDHVLFVFGIVAEVAGNQYDKAIDSMIKSIKK